MRRRRHRPESEIGDSAPVEIIDKPAMVRYAFHPDKKSQNIVICKMVSEQGANDTVDGIACWIDRIHIANDPSNSAIDRGELSRNANGLRIQINSCEPNAYLPAHSPILNPAQHVASAAANIEDM